MKNLWSLSDDGQLDLHFHPGQAKGWQSNRRFVAVLAGKQSGKTSWGPWWLWREVLQTAKAGELNDYLAVTASYDLFKLKMLPSLRETFEQVLGIGRYWAGPRVIELCDLDPTSPTYGHFKARRADDAMWGRIILRAAAAQTGLASASGKAAWLDEAGEDTFTLETWDEVQARVSLERGRVLFTTTLYNLGWLKQQIYDPWTRGDSNIEVIQFDSTLNPSFDKVEAERLRSCMPLWKYNMHYRGHYSRPAGMIYDCFDEQKHKVPRFAIPQQWKRYLGLDFGGVNTAGLFYAEEPRTGRLYLYREYKAGGRTAKEHARALLEGEPMIPSCVGGSQSEGQWRNEFRAGGLPVREPDQPDVEVGIDRVYGAFKRDQVYVFDDLAGYLDQKLSYSRPVDENGEPLEGIKDKRNYHFMDAERYILGWRFRPVSVTKSSNYLHDESNDG